MKNINPSITFFNISANGNTFLICDNKEKSKLLFQKEILALADGIILLSPSLTSSSHYSIYNKDGNKAKICGNGLIASTFYLKEILNRNESDFTFLTDSGYFKTKVNEISYSVFYPLPKIILSKDNCALIDAFNIHQVEEVNEINPSTMIKEKEVLNMPINLHQFKQIEENKYSYVSLENGVGFTQSCLSGAASVYAYLYYQKGIDTKITLKAAGGTFIIHLSDYNTLEIEGLAKLIFKGYVYE